MQTILITLLSLIALSVNAQYTVNTISQPYQPLSNPTIVTSPNSPWDANSIYQVYFNFDFDIYGQNYTALNLYAGGGLKFAGLGQKELLVVHSPFGGYFLEDLEDTNNPSTIGYTIEGNAGSRILKIEWTNAGFKNSSNSGDMIDFQIWLYEQTNCFEIRFGTNQFSSSSFGQSPNQTQTLSIKLSYDDCSNILGIKGAANLPSYWFYNSCFPNYSFLDGNPNSGVTYVICPSTTTNTSAIEQDNAVTIYPNPTQDIITIKTAIDLNNYSAQLFDLTGKQLPVVLNTTDNSMDIHTIPSGMYTLILSNEAGNVIHKKIIKQ